MHIITKKFEGYPFAHRQPNHDGHCALIHGHNWDFEVTLASEELDENGFVFDFGKFKKFRAWLEDNFDHTLVLNEDDPIQDAPGWPFLDSLSDVVLIPSCSCEGIAEYVFKYLSSWLQDEVGFRVRLVAVTVYEDIHNKARYTEVER